jgi:2-polyprenyl-3-methyl-5-hydroxy-6-metoxy-1,4-benzoquinol methylase
MKTSPAKLLDPAIDRASAHWRDLRPMYYYSRGKMRWDPAYALLAKLLGSATTPVLDVGCGAGLLASFLRESGVHRPWRGVDLDTKKIQLAQDRIASAYPGMQFFSGNAADCRPASEDLVALDVLHYFSTAEQIELLQNWAHALSPGHRMFLRNGVRDAVGWRHLMTSLEEAWVRGSGWIRGGQWNFPAKAQVLATLRGAGLQVVAVPMWGRTPFSSYLFVAHRLRA